MPNQYEDKELMGQVIVILGADNWVRIGEESRAKLMQLITQKQLEARMDELKKVDPIASHELAATVADRIAELTKQEGKR